MKVWIRNRFQERNTDTYKLDGVREKKSEDLENIRCISENKRVLIRDDEKRRRMKELLSQTI